MKNIFLVSVSLLICGGCSAEQSSDEAATNRGLAEIQLIGDNLVRDGSKYPHQSVVVRMNEIISGISNKVCRIEVARSYAKMLGCVDFSALPFKKRGAMAPLYGQHICYAFRLMVKNGVDPKEAMSRFFDCLTKFYDAQDSLSALMKSADEGQGDYIVRKECARALRDAYEYTISLLVRFWIPHLEDYLPSEYHEEFKTKFELFSAKIQHP